MPVASSTRRARASPPPAEACWNTPSSSRSTATASPRSRVTLGYCSSCARAGGIQRGGRRALLGEQPADGVGRQVALAPGVDQQHVAAGAAEDERGVEPGGSAADDQTVMQMRHVLISYMATEASASTARS